MALNVKIGLVMIVFVLLNSGVVTLEIPSKIVWPDEWTEWFKTAYKDTSNAIQKQKNKIKEKIKNSNFFSLRTDLTSPINESVLSVPARVIKNGYKFEVHLVESNGYVLSVHRVRCSRSSNGISSKTVLLQHGLLGSSADWLLSGPGKGLAYVLANAGYDVWMANVRGNKYSREHFNYSTDSEAYWNFTWHDVAVQDLPTIIDYINERKNNDSDLVFIGKSMGTTMMFVMLALRPEYNHLLKAGVAIAPLAYMSGYSTYFKNLAQILVNLGNLERKMGSYEFSPDELNVTNLMTACQNERVNDTTCKQIIYFLTGREGEDYDQEKYLLLLRYLGKGTSWKTVVHYAQQVLMEKFKMYDYGENNTKVYGIDTPNSYNMSTISLPITMFWSKCTTICYEENIKKLASEVNNCTLFDLSTMDPKFNFTDYMLGKNRPEILNDKVLEYLTKVF